MGPGPADPEKWLKINPTTKAAIRWSSIGLGIAVPSPVVISKLLEESNDEQKGPSIADLTWNGLEAVAQHIVKPFYPSASECSRTGTFDDPIFRQDGSFGHSQARVA